MKKIAFLLACAFALAGRAHADTVTIRVDAGALENALGTSPVPNGGLLQLIASPSGTFSAPTSSSYATGDNVVLSNFAMNTNGGTAEVFQSLTISNTGLSTGEALTLRFYPSLTLAAMPSAPTLSTTYGQVRSNTIEFGTNGGVPSETAWVLPASGAAVNLEYVTLSNGGTYANTTAYATNVVGPAAVPEPSTILLSGAVALWGLVSLRRRA